MEGHLYQYDSNVSIGPVATCGVYLLARFDRQAMLFSDGQFKVPNN